MGAQFKKGALSRFFGGITRLCLMVGLMLGSAAVHALSLGEIEIHSRLGEPLKATIPVAASQAELKQLVVEMAYPSVYRNLGIEQGELLETVQITLVMNQGEPRIELSSTRRINEPMFTIVLSADWGRSRMNRPYDIFLSP